MKNKKGKEDETMKKKNADKKVGLGRLLLWQSSSVSVAISVLVIGFVTIYCTDTLGLEPAIVGAVFALSKIVDAVTDVIAGFIIDRTNTRWGKGRPYEIFMLFLWLSTWLLFSCPTGFSNVAKYIWLFIMYIFMNAVCTTFLNANNVVYMVRAFKTREQQTKVVAFGSFFTMGAGFIFNMFFPMAMAKMATSPAGWSRLIGMLAIPMTVIGMIRILTIKEKYNNEADNKEEKLNLKDVATLFKTNQGFVNLSIVRLLQSLVAGLGVGVYYFTWIVGNVGLMGVTAVFTILGLPLAFFMPMMRRKLGMKKMIMGSFVISIIGYMVMFFAKSSLPLVILSGLITNVAIVPFTMLFNMFIVDCADYNESIGRPRMEGTLGSVTGFASKVGSALGGFLIGILLSIGGYSGTAAAQTGTALMTIRLSASVVPALIFVIMILIFRKYNIDEKKQTANLEKADVSKTNETDGKTSEEK